MKSQKPGVLNIVMLLVGTINLTFVGTSVLADDAVRQAPRPLKAGDVGVGSMVPDLAFVDIDGKAGRLSDYGDAGLLVIAFTGTSCPLNLKYAPTLSQLEKEFLPRGVRFLFVNPTVSDSEASIREAISHHQLLGRYVADRKREMATALHGDTTTEVFVLDRKRTLLYRGAIDDQYGLGYVRNTPAAEYLRFALESILANNRPRVEATWAPGCDLGIDVPESSTTITYHNRISRIIQQRCGDCHREGGLGPFALDTFDDLMAHAAMVETVIKQGRMPAWTAEGPVIEVEDHPLPTQLWANDSSLSSREKADLLQWLQGDHPVGDPQDAPLDGVYSEGWNIGRPDLTYKIPEPVTVQATGQMSYIHKVVDPKFTEDQWVQAVEIRPTARQAVHHVLVYVLEPGGDNRINERSGFVGAYVPGNSFQVFAPQHAKQIPAGSRLLFQLHYTPIGRELVDQTELGIRLAKQPPRYHVRNHGIANGEIEITARDENYSADKTWTVRQDLELTGFMPHMHLRGKAFRYELTDPEGQVSVLLDVPRYDFNWQLEYRLVEPIHIQQGSQIKVTGWFDNSANNPANPDPNQTVYWGDQTDEEMLIGYVEFVVPREPDDASTQAGLPTTPQEVKRAFAKADSDGDGKVTPAELKRPQLFKRLDADQDGVVTLEEALQGLAKKSER